ncbi:hypothetical protein QJS10_CPB17g02524 [Acorus calamus]|uniref:Uncharacterized protein n=1 Tax=Acorus calamus TaxID=4465 RepID=A0AAV9CTY3_ACOCL|nr:hypothetical protein QJS10_CPB17g02524 [Acorus calamus]
MEELNEEIRLLENEVERLLPSLPSATAARNLVFETQARIPSPEHGTRDAMEELKEEIRLLECEVKSLIESGLLRRRSQEQPRAT